MPYQIEILFAGEWAIWCRCCETGQPPFCTATMKRRDFQGKVKLEGLAHPSLYRG